MVQDVINELKVSLHEALYLDLDDLGLEVQGAEVISKFIGVHLGAPGTGHGANQPLTTCTFRFSEARPATGTTTPQARN